MAQEQGNPWNDYLGKQKSAINEMKFTEEKHTVRICPPKNGVADNFFGYIVHWIKQSSGATMPIFHADGEQCEVCRAVSFLRQKKNILKNEKGLSDDSKEVKKLDTTIFNARPSKKLDMNVIDRDDDTNKDKSIKIKRWTIGPMLSNPLFEYARDYGSPSHDETGYDLSIKITNKGGGFKEYKLMTAKRNGCDPMTEEELESLNKHGYDVKSLREKDFSTKERIKDVIMNAASNVLKNAVLHVTNDKNSELEDDVNEEESAVSNDVAIEIEEEDLLDSETNGEEIELEEDELSSGDTESDEDEEDDDFDGDLDLDLDDEDEDEEDDDFDGDLDLDLDDEDEDEDGKKK